MEKVDKSELWMAASVGSIAKAEGCVEATHGGSMVKANTKLRSLKSKLKKLISNVELWESEMSFNGVRQFDARESSQFSSQKTEITEDATLELETSMSRIDSMESTLTSIAKSITSMEATAKTKVSKQQEAPLSSILNHPVAISSLEPCLRDRDILVKQLELPVFDGVYPYCWILRIEEFFNKTHVSETEKLRLVSSSFNDDVLIWYNEELDIAEFADWSDFKRRLKARIAPVQPQCGPSLLTKNDSVHVLNHEKESFGVMKAIQKTESFSEPKSMSEHVSPQIEDSIQSKVSLLHLEPCLRYCRESLDVFEERLSEFDHGNLNRKLEAHQTFYGMLIREYSSQQQKKTTKISKSWRFKFKNRSRTRELVQEQVWFKDIVEANNNGCDLGHANYEILEPFFCLIERHVLINFAEVLENTAVLSSLTSRREHGISWFYDREYQKQSLLATVERIRIMMMRKTISGLNVDCILHRFGCNIWVTKSQKQKMCKNWWFKFKPNVSRVRLEQKQLESNIIERIMWEKSDSRSSCAWYKWRRKLYMKHLWKSKMLHSVLELELYIVIAVRQFHRSHYRTRFLTGTNLQTAFHVCKFVLLLQVQSQFQRVLHILWPTYVETSFAMEYTVGTKIERYNILLLITDVLLQGQLNMEQKPVKTGSYMELSDIKGIECIRQLLNLLFGFDLRQDSSYVWHRWRRKDHCILYAFRLVGSYDHKGTWTLVI